MSKGQTTTHVERSVRRPLLGLLGACVVGGMAGGMAGPWPLGALGLAWAATLAVRPLRESRVQGIAWVLLLLLTSLAILRGRAQTVAVAPTHTGIWRTLFESRDLVGTLDGQTTRYELPLGTVRDGERVELLPSRSPQPHARGLAGLQTGSDLPPSIKLYADEIRRLQAAPRERLWPGRLAWRRLRARVLTRLERIKDPAARGMAAALLFGDRSQLDPRTTDLFTRTGTRHALAVSGLHVGLVASLWIWPLGALLAWCLLRLPFWPSAVRRWIRPEVVRIALLLSFIPLAGAGAPVIRAALALGLMQTAELLPARGKLQWKRQPDALSLWSFAALLEWCANPAALESISMQLSYIATLGLILLTRPAERCLRRVLPGAGVIRNTGRRGHPRPAAVRVLGQRAINWTITGLAASFAASLATLPLVWHTFGEWSLAGPIATLFLLPLLAAFLCLAWLELVWPLALVEWALAWIASAMESGLAFFDNWPGTPVPLPMRPLELLWVAGLALLLAVTTRGLLAATARRVCLASWGIAIVP